MSLPKQPLLASLTPFPRVLFAFLLMIACFGITFLAALLLAGPLFGTSVSDITTILSNYDDPKTLRLLEYFQMVQSIGLFIIPPFLAGFFFEGDSLRYLHLDRSSRWMAYLLTIMLMTSSLPFINGLVTWNEKMVLPESLRWLEEWMKSTEAQATKLTELFMKMPTFGAFLFNLLMVAIVPAVGEELVFRGLFQRLFKEWLGNIHVAIFISAFLFSAMHMQFYGFIPRLVLGLILGYLFYFSGSLWIPILAHFLQNGTVVAVTYRLGERGVIQGDYENFGTTDNITIILASLAMIVFSLWLIKRFSVAKAKTEDNI